MPGHWQLPKLWAICIYTPARIEKKKKTNEKGVMLGVTRNGKILDSPLIVMIYWNQFDS